MNDLQIRRLRNKCGLSQKQLAKAVLVSQQAVAKWENSICLPSTNKLLQLAKILNCTVDELLREDERKQ